MVIEYPSELFLFSIKTNIIKIQMKILKFSKWFSQLIDMKDDNSQSNLDQGYAIPETGKSTKR